VAVFRYKDNVIGQAMRTMSAVPEGRKRSHHTCIVVQCTQENGLSPVLKDGACARRYQPWIFPLSPSSPVRTE
jgi:hypothetical protein